MKTISDAELEERIRLDNPWWETREIPSTQKSMVHRAYFSSFYPFVTQFEPRRAVVLMGPRRVGKTVMLLQSVQKLIDEGDASADSICCLDLQSPTYAGIRLERLLSLSRKAAGKSDDEQFYMMFDEIQYLAEWEVQLKNLVDSKPNVKFVASGSAAAALRVKSVESGAGRFTDFMLPPVTFYEFLTLIRCGEDSVIRIERSDSAMYLHHEIDIEAVNEHFFNYINFGGYPEAILSDTVRSDPGRYIGRDIIEKVLTRDLPSLYGIHDVSELNRLFTMLAYNTAQELSLEALSQSSGITKATIKRYIEYLEAAFLIKVLHRIDHNAKRFKRANFFKVYLTNPCMRAALFSPVDQDAEHAGSLVETAIVSQWFHLDENLHYARWATGEVDIVFLDSLMLRPMWCMEIKWSDDPFNNPQKLKSLRRFVSKNPRCRCYVTARTETGQQYIDGVSFSFLTAAAYCYFIGYSVIEKKSTEFAAQLASTKLLNFNSDSAVDSAQGDA